MRRRAVQPGHLQQGAAGPGGSLRPGADGSAEVRKLLCATLENGPRVRFCTTHITPSNTSINGEKINETQLGQVRTHLENFEAAGNTEGLCGQSKKLDLIFARGNHLVGGYSGDSLAISAKCGKACSDHNIVVGTVTLRTN